MHTKFERLLSKSLTTLEVMTYYLVVHTGPDDLNVRLSRSLFFSFVEVSVSAGSFREKEMVRMFLLKYCK